MHHKRIYSDELNNQPKLNRRPKMHKADTLNTRPRRLLLALLCIFSCVFMSIIAYKWDRRRLTQFSSILRSFSHTHSNKRFKCVDVLTKTAAMCFERVHKHINMLRYIHDNIKTICMHMRLAAIHISISI